MSQLATAPQPLSILSEEETMFRDAVREFAEAEIRPYVSEMDEAAQFRPDIIAKFFGMGLMGIEVPEQYGGAGAGIFLATIAIEELARVDASAAIYVDVHNPTDATIKATVRSAPGFDLFGSFEKPVQVPAGTSVAVDVP